MNNNNKIPAEHIQIANKLKESINKEADELIRNLTYYGEHGKNDSNAVIQCIAGNKDEESHLELINNQSDILLHNMNLDIEIIKSNIIISQTFTLYLLLYIVGNSIATILYIYLC